MVSDDLSERRRRVEDRVTGACAASGRDPGEVRIVAVTKGHPAATVVAALEAGFREIGENRVGEATGKFLRVAEALDRHGAVRHMVGHLQRNKTRDAVASFDWIQSVDSIRLARALSRRVEEGSGALPVLVQVNVAGEEQKHGFEPDVAVERAHEIAELPGLAVRGIMTMAPLTDDEGVLRATFGRARRIFEELDRTGEAPDTLSMGMSGDYPLAVEEGATMIRLGTALFGPRTGD